MISLFILLILAVYFDVRTFHIPNALVLLGYGAGAIYRILVPGKIFFWYPLSAILLFLLLIPIYKLHAIGGGDVKLFSVCAMFRGLSSGISIVICSLFIGGLISLIYLVYHRFILKNLKRGRHVIHFSIPICLGVVVHELGGGFLWQNF